MQYILFALQNSTHNKEHMNEGLPSPLICDGDDTTPIDSDKCVIINASDTAAHSSNVGRHITTETSDDDSRFSQTSKMSSVPNRANTTTSNANDDEERSVPSVPGARHENDAVPNNSIEKNSAAEIDDENSGGTDPALTIEVGHENDAFANNAMESNNRREVNNENSDCTDPALRTDADALTNDAPNKNDELYNADDGDDNSTDSDNKSDTNQDSDAKQSHDETDRSGSDEGGLFGWLDEHEANEDVNFFFRIRTSNGSFATVTKKRSWTGGWDLDKVNNTFPVVNCLDIVGLCAET